MKKQIVLGMVAATAATSVFATANQAQAAVFVGSTTMDTVLQGTGNQFVAFGKLEFSNFTYSSAGGAIPMDAADVTITEFTDGSRKGILMNAAFFSNSPTGDIALGYTLKSLDPDFSFDGALLGVLGVSSGEIVVTEQILDSGFNSIGNLLAIGTVDSPGIDTTTFSTPVGMLRVLKDMELVAGADPDQFSIVLQIFDHDGDGQRTPEPSFILGLGGVAILGALSRKQKRQ